MEEVDVLAKGLVWHCPVDKVKLVGEVTEDGADVVVIFPVYKLWGRIDMTGVSKLMSLRLLTGAKVVAREEDGLLRWLKSD
jgi:hypothetical protein